MAVGDGIHGLAQFGQWGVFIDVAPDPFLDQTAGQLLFRFSGEDQNAQAGDGIAEAVEDFDAADVWQEDVEDQDVGLKSQGHFDPSGTVGRGADYTEFPFGLEHFGDQFADGSLVFDDDDGLGFDRTRLHGELHRVCLIG